MQHSVKDIGQRYQELSELRKENPLFESDKFFEFAKQNSNKYSIIENGDDLLVSTWYSDKLIEDFQKSTKIKTMELTIEHLAAYLPYGLKVKTDSLGIFKVNGYRTIPSRKISILTNDTHVGFLQEIQLVLRPLSDLTKEIEHNGEKFVPIERILSERKCDAEYEFIEAIEDDWASAESKFEFAPYSIIKKLHSWHFDTFGLIEAGLAIDINELNK